MLASLLTLSVLASKVHEEISGKYFQSLLKGTCYSVSSLQLTSVCLVLDGQTILVK